MGMEQNFKLAVKSLMSSKARAILTMLGIIIGVAAVIIITSLGNGMQTMMNEQFEKIGTNLDVYKRQPLDLGFGPLAHCTLKYRVTCDKIKLVNWNMNGEAR